ncbi:hypothetical protein [Myxosarcina sp. GI1(2024)]
MFPNLLQATTKYWRQLDELEVAYQRGEIPLEEVDAKVADLMAELARERRTALNYFWHACRLMLTRQIETLIGLAVLTIVTYTWVLTS